MALSDAVHARVAERENERVDAARRFVERYDAIGLGVCPDCAGNLMRRWFGMFDSFRCADCGKIHSRS